QPALVLLAALPALPGPASGSPVPRLRPRRVPLSRRAGLVDRRGVGRLARARSRAGGPATTAACRAPKGRAGPGPQARPAPGTRRHGPRAKVGRSLAGVRVLFVFSAGQPGGAELAVLAALRDRPSDVAGRAVLLSPGTFEQELSA